MITLLDDKFTFSNFGFKEIDGSSKPITPEYDHKTVKIPQRNGYWDFGTEINGLSFSIPLMIPMQNKQIKEKKLNKLKAFLTDEHHRPRLIKFVFDYEPDKFIFAKLSQQVDFSRVKIGQILTLNFTTNDPVKYAKSDEYDPETAPEYDLVKEGDYYKNTQKFDWLYRVHYSAFYNYSSYVTSIKITIKGSISRASVTHYQSGVKLTIPDMVNGVMVIDTKTYSISINGKDLSEGSNYEFFEVGSGENGFTFEGSVSNAKVEYNWYHEF